METDYRFTQQTNLIRDRPIEKIGASNVKIGHLALILLGVKNQGSKMTTSPMQASDHI
jgi:hypothetical protein